MPLVFEAMIEPGSPMLLDAFVQAAFDLEILDDGFDDQIAVFQLGEVVFEVTDRYERTQCQE